MFNMKQLNIYEVFFRFLGFSTCLHKINVLKNAQKITDRQLMLQNSESYGIYNIIAL